MPSTLRKVGNAIHRRIDARSPTVWRAQYGKYRHLHYQWAKPNPQLVINYLGRKQLIPFWANTSSNKMIKAATREYDKAFKEGYEELIERGTVTVLANYEAPFHEIRNISSLWGLFAPQVSNVQTPAI